MEDAATAELHGRIGDAAQHLALLPHQGGIDQSRQPFDRKQVGFGPLTLDKQLLLAETAQLVQTPGKALGAKAAWFADPAQQAMHRRMHPSHHADAVLMAFIATHLTPQQVAE